MTTRHDGSDDQIPVTRQLHSSGNSTVLTIPPDILEEAGLSEGDTVSFEVLRDGGVILHEGARTTDHSTPTANNQ